MTQHLALPWTAEQRAIITAASDARLLVDAGPGTGKTAVACGRVAHLIDLDGLSPESIWMVSFTRTAVHEIRSRIASYLQDPSDARTIRIATLDSHSWSIRSGFDEGASLSGSYEENITTVTDMVRNHDGVFEYLGGVQHLLVDEAQDMVGARAELVLTLIEALPRETGVTVLADEAQGIYGFAEGGQREDAAVAALPEAIRQDLGDEFDQRALLQVHRTDDAGLLALLFEGRAVVRPSTNTENVEPLRSINEIIRQHNHGAARNAFDITVEPPSQPDMFLLFRRRGEALQASGYFGTAPRRLRLSGLPTPVHAWIALLLWDWTQQTINEAEFLLRWQQRLPGTPGPDLAWGSLVRVAGESATRISVPRLASIAARQSPPADLCSPDFGVEGPIVGTIHAAKGREASEVRLYLPATVSDQDCSEAEEEARVLFVGASRAQGRLLVGKAERSWPRQLDSGRAYTPRTRQRRAAASVEIGRAGDLAADGLTGKRFFSGQEDVEWAQSRLLASAGSGVAELKAKRSGPDLGWAYALQTSEGESVGYLGQQVGRDLFEVAAVVDERVRQGRRKPPGWINNLSSLGLRTLAVDPDSPIRQQLHEPWSESGFMLAPLLTGYPWVGFWR